MLRIRAPKEFWSGLLFLGIGLAGAYLARDYDFGRTLRMGPGYLPTVLSWCTAALGILILVRAFIADGPAVGRTDWRSLVFVLLAIVVFAWLITRAGLIAAIIATTIIGGLASRELGRIELMVLSLAIAIFCALVFVVGLGQPMPLWPDWVGDRLRAWMG